MPPPTRSVRPPTRRSYLRALAVALGVGAGCVGSPGGSTGTTTPGTSASTPPSTTTPGNASSDDRSPGPPTQTGRTETEGSPTNPRAMTVGSNWPSFQFDARNSGTNAAVDAVPADPTRYWRYYTRTGAPVVDDGTLFTASNPHRRFLVARDAATGEERWRSEIPHSAPAPAPGLDANRAYALSYGKFHAFDRSDGTELWSADVGSGKPMPPIATGDAVFAVNRAFEGSPAHAFAYAPDGTRRWRTSLAADVPGPAAYDRETLYVPTERGVTGFDAADGTRLFHRKGVVARSGLSTDGDSLYVVEHDGTLVALDAATGETRWTFSTGRPERGSVPAVDADTVYVAAQGGLWAIAKDGTRRWRFDGSDYPYATPAVDASRVYVGGAGFDDRTLHALDVDTGEERWRYETEQKTIGGDHVTAGVNGPPALVDGGLFVAAADGMHAVGKQ